MSNMDRMDSGFDASCRLKASEEERLSVHRSNTAPTRRHNNNNISIDAARNSPAAPMENRSSSERRLRRSGEPRRSSIASSSDQSGKSRGRYSKPSSRRTSCTLVDPSRPARHYRVKSSQTVPTAGHDIDDVLALHFRSCSIFQSPAYQTSQFNSGVVAVDTHGSSIRSFSDSAPAPRLHADSIKVATTTTSPKHSDETVATVELTTTTTHWMSSNTRRREYERIDKENSGIQGLVRRIVPRCVSGPPPPKFYDNEKDTSDTGSVRRYRMDIEEDDEVGEKAIGDEKSTSSLRVQSRKLTPRDPSRMRPSVKSKKKFWGCF